MNELSWLLYFSGFIGNFDALITTSIIIFSVLFAVLMIGKFIQMADSGCFQTYSRYNREREEQDKYSYYKESKGFHKFGYIAAFFICISVFVPSKQTVLMIAASQIGEQVVTSEKMQGIIDPSLDLLKKKIQDELSSYTKKD